MTSPTRRPLLPSAPVVDVGGRGEPPPRVRHAWLQTHPTPAARAGEFHWYPVDADRELRARCVERMRGLEPPAILWELAPGRVSWAQLFAAISPGDGRRYIGVVLTSAREPGAPPGELLAAISLPPAAPWSGDDVRIPDTTHPAPDEPVIAALARGLLSGGSIAIGDPSHHALPRTVASLAHTLPELALEGAWLGGPPTAADRVATLVARAWPHPRSRAGVAWTMLRELAAARGITCDQLATELGTPTALTDAERRLVGSGDPIAVLHAWGRGQLDASATAATLVTRLADSVGLRALATAIAGDDPRRTLAEVRWHALLPTPHRTALLAELARRMPSLRTLMEPSHA